MHAAAPDPITVSLTDLRSTVPAATGRIGFDERRRRMALAMTMKIPSAAYLNGKFNGQKLIICGGGPSIEKTLPDIRRQLRMSKRVKVLALNKTHDWLLSKGLQPDIAAMADPAPHCATYQTPQKGTIYLLGSTLHADSFARFAKQENTFLWHPTNDDEGDKQWFEQNYAGRALCRVSGKSTVGLRMLTLPPCVMGFSELELHGYDSCDAPHVSGKPRKLYPYDKPNMERSFKDVTMKSKSGHEFHYETNEHMARQSYEFFDALQWIAEAQRDGRMRRFDITVAGDGAIPWQAWRMNDTGGIHATPERMKAKYGDAKYFDYVTGSTLKPDNTPSEYTVNFDDMEPMRVTYTPDDAQKFAKKVG